VPTNAQKQSIKGSIARARRAVINQVRNLRELLSPTLVSSDKSGTHKSIPECICKRIIASTP